MLERKRVEDLLGDAAALRRARDIRAYVEEASNANAAAPEPITAVESRERADHRLKLSITLPFGNCLNDNDVDLFCLDNRHIIC